MKRRIYIIAICFVVLAIAMMFTGCDLIGSIGDKHKGENGELEIEEDKDENGEFEIEEEKVYTPDTEEFQQELKKLKDRYQEIMEGDGFVIQETYHDMENGYRVIKKRFWHYQNGMVELRYQNHGFIERDHKHCCLDEGHKYYYKENDVDYVLTPIIDHVTWEKHFADIDAFYIINMFKFEDSDFISYKDGYFKLSNEKWNNSEIRLDLTGVSLLLDNFDSALTLDHLREEDKIELPTDIVDFTTPINSAEYQQNLKQFIDKVLNERNFTINVNHGEMLEGFGDYLYFDGKKSKSVSHVFPYEEYYFEDEDIYIENDIDQIMKYYFLDNEWNKFHDKVRYDSEVFSKVIENLNLFKDFELTDDNYDRYTDTYIIEMISEKYQSEVYFEIKFSGDKLNLKFRGNGAGNFIYDIYDVGETHVELPKYYYDLTTHEYVGEPEK